MRILFLGDSITAGCNAQSPDTNFVSLVGSMTGFECLNYGVGGTRIAPTNGKVINPDYEEDFLKRAKRMPEGDLVFVMGGTNDFGHGDAPIGNKEDYDELTFYGAINRLYDYLSKRYTKRCVKVILPLPRFDMESTRGEFFKTKEEGSLPLKGYCKIIAEVSKKYGFDVLDFNDNFGGFISDSPFSNPYISGDGVHPNQFGHHLLANLIVEYLKNNHDTHYDNLTTIGDVKNDDSFLPYSKYFFYEWGKESDSGKVCYQHKFVLDGLNKLYEYYKRGLTDFYYIDDKDPNINIMHLKHNDKRKVAIVLAGGALYAVCNAIESIPIGLRIYDLGYDVAILTYKVQSKAYHGQSVEDVANAVSYLLNKEKELNIDMKDYAVIGSSAAGYVAALFGSNNHGYLTYQLPKPGLIGLQYPVISMNQDCPHSFTKQMVLGEGNVSQDLEDEFTIYKHIDKTYPKCFVTRAIFEGDVDVKNSDLLVEELKKHDIPYRYDIRPGIGHGWGVGTHLVFEGWVDNMISFWKK